MIKKETFQSRLKSARQSRGLSKSGLAHRAKIDPSYISHYEMGSRKPSFNSLIKLAIALEVTTDYLLGCNETMSKRYCQLIAKLSYRDKRIVKHMIDFMVKRKSNYD